MAQKKEKAVRVWAILCRDGSFLRYDMRAGWPPYLWPNRSSAHLNCAYSVGQEPVRVEIRILPKKVRKS